MTIQAVVFDWAGTTVDYGSRAPIIAFQRAFARFGIGLSEATIRTDVGLDKIKHVEKILKQPVNWQQWQTQHPEVNLEAAVELVYAQFQTEVAQVIGETAILKSGMKALINYLNQHHLQIATTSGYTESMVAQNLKMTARQGYQPEINITSEQTDLIGRPQAAMLNLAMKRMHIDDPQTVIKIGDTVNDILEGKNAHTISVGVVEGSNVIGLSAAEFDELSESQRQEYCRTARKTFEDAGADFTVDTMADLIPLIDQLNMPTHEAAPLLLTPGPLTTSESVKQTMMVDHGTWDDDYKQVTQQIRQELLAVGQANPADYTSVLIQGSGTYGVEATLSTALNDESVLLIAINGAYGRRMREIVERIGVRHVEVEFAEDEPLDVERLLAMIDLHPEITHVALVHCETTTGILNPIESIVPALKRRGVLTIVDAMSSFGGVPISIDELQVDYLISSSNKCIQGVPGFSFVIAKTVVIEQTEGNANTLSLDLYDQWKCFEEHDGKWRFTSPTHVVYAFQQALHELKQEGGVAARFKRYQQNEQMLRDQMMQLGYRPVINQAVQSPIITSFKYPSSAFDFRNFYDFLRQRGFIIYPGKVSKINSFRIGSIGEVTTADIQRLIELVQTYEIVAMVN